MKESQRTSREVSLRDHDHLAERGPFDDDWVEQYLAAAIEELADQVVPEEELLMNVRGTREWHKAIQRADTRSKLLAIAADLRGTNTPTETP